MWKNSTGVCFIIGYTGEKIVEIKEKQPDVAKVDLRILLNFNNVVQGVNPCVTISIIMVYILIFNQPT